MSHPRADDKKRNDDQVDRQVLDSPTRGLAAVFSDFGGVYFVNAVVAFLFAASGPLAIILAIGARGGLSPADLASWTFGAFFINGLISIGFCWRSRQPLVFFWTSLALCWSARRSAICPGRK